MASIAKRLKANVAGEFFVDSACIDCGTCRQIAPDAFAAGEDASYVHRQPVGAEQAHRARMALIACPVAAIGTETKQPLAEARAAFPELIDNAVYYCGWAAESSYGARSYLVVRRRGNILVDSPRFASALTDRIEALGGVRWMFLTHRDDVADHAKFRRHFGCERILHLDDVTSGTRDVEIKLQGTDPVVLDEEVVFIPVPGHTAGSVCMLYRNRFMFSGDHLWWDATRGHLVASRNVCWFNWREQTRSMEKLVAYRFEWLLPGHGMRGRLSPAQMTAELERCAGVMRQRAA